jgi:surfeit locus 1 family protein
VGGQTRLDIPNDHLQYALTWYALAAILVVMFVVYHRRQAKEGKRP